VFEEVARVALPIAIIGDITDILVFDEQILVTDRKSDRVLARGRSE